MSTKHTPGPWRQHGCRIEWIDPKDGWAAVLAHVYEKGPDTDIEPGADMANARLIAAAPDLLAACEALVAARWHDADYGAIKERARAAIRKAKETT